MRRRSRNHPRKRPKQHRAQGMVDAILTATARVLAREGYARATTNRIADVAGVSIGSLYQYFPNKHALFSALRQRHYRALTEMLSGAAGVVENLPLRKAIRAGVELNLAVHSIDPELHRILDEEVPAMDVERNREVEQLGFATALKTLTARQSEIRPKNHELAAFLVAHTIEALTHAAVVHHREMLHDDEFIEALTDMLYRYLAREV